MAGQFLQLRDEMRGECSAVRAEIRDGDAALGEEIRRGDEETRNYMRVLHEEVIARIATIGEGGSPPKPKPKARR